MYSHGLCENNPPGVITNPWRPKDGPGPRGAPDCYYTSRVLDSTARYVSFVNALRREEQRVAFNDAVAAEALLDLQKSKFFDRTDRKNCINKVAGKVQLCLESVEDDLDKKRERLKELLLNEEEKHISMFVEQAQEGKVLIAKQREERLKELLEMRRIDQMLAPRAYHVYLTDNERLQRDKEEKIMHQYQIREKQAIKSQEIEYEKMWKAVEMKYDEAMDLRERYDSADRYRQNQECKHYMDMSIQMKKDKEEAQRLKDIAEGKAEQQKIIKAIEEAKKAEAEEQAAIREKNKRIVTESLKLSAETLKKKETYDRTVKEAYDSMADQWKPGHAAKLACRKRREVENAEFNRLLIAEAKTLHKSEDESEKDVKKMAAEIQAKDDERRCKYIRWARDLAAETKSVRAQQIAAKKNNEQAKARARDDKEWGAMFRAHLERMDELQAEADFAKNKDHQHFIVRQAAEQKALEEKLLAEEAAKKYGVTLPDRIDESEPRPEDIHSFSRRLRAARSEPPLQLCNCYDKNN